jgi:hypothetical protein
MNERNKIQALLFIFGMLEVVNAKPLDNTFVCKEVDKEVNNFFSSLSNSTDLIGDLLDYFSLSDVYIVPTQKLLKFYCKKIV